MEDWHVDLAQQFKDRDNPRPMGAMLGLVVAIGDNWLVTLKDGAFKVDKTNGYICNQILRHEADYSYEHAGTTTVGGCLGGPNTNYSAKGNGKIHIKPLWQVGDHVLVVPDVREQHFFIVDIVR